MKRALACALLIGCGKMPQSHSPSGRAADVAAACVTLVSCGLDVEPIAHCTTHYDFLGDYGVLLSDAQLACVAHAGADCAAAAACLGGNGCPAAPRCNGTLIEYCTSGGQPASFDCTSRDPGETCVDHGNGSVDCMFGTCTEPYQTRCQGAFTLDCQNGLWTSIDCGLDGATCAGPQSACTGTGPACTPPKTYSPLRCDGTTLVKCDEGREAAFDCASRGLGCYPSAPPEGAHLGCANGNACDLYFVATCGGSKLTYCDFGYVETIDCAARGFQHGCTSGTSATGARCAP